MVRPRDPHPLRAVIFDWAGTLVDFGCQAPVHALLDVFAAVGVLISAAEARQDMGLLKKDHLRAILQQPRVREEWLRMSGAAPSEEDVERVFASFLPRQTEVLARHCDVIPGVPGLLAGLRERGLRIGSTTGYTRALLDVILPRAAAAGCAPDVAVTPDDVTGGRPSPWMCFRNLQLLNVYPPRACVKVGDTPADIEEGRNAGMWTIGVLDSGNEIGLTAGAWDALSAAEQHHARQQAAARLRQAGADFLVHTAAGILPVLEEIESNGKHGLV